MYTNEGWAAHKLVLQRASILYRSHQSRFSHLLETVSQCCSSRVLLTIFKRCLFQQKPAREAEAALRFHPPVLADGGGAAQRRGCNHGDGDGRPRGERCYQNTAANQQMFPHKMERKSPVLWEKMRRFVLKHFLKSIFEPYRQKTRASKPLT